MNLPIIVNGFGKLDEEQIFFFRFSLISFLILVNSLFSVFPFDKFCFFPFYCISSVNCYKLYYKRENKIKIQRAILLKGIAEIISVYLKIRS